jgi:hypothetical protein
MLGDVCLLKFLQTIDLRTALRPANALESQRRFPISLDTLALGVPRMQISAWDF